MSTYQPYNGGDYNSGDYNSGGFDNNGSSQANRGPTKSTLTPVTIKQINDSKVTVQDGEYSVNNIELNQVSFVAVIRSITDNASNLLIQLEDGTGTIEVRKWVDENNPVQLNDHQYVYVTGSVKEFGGKKNIQHATFRPVTDFNEVIYHQLASIDVYVKAQPQFNKGISNGGQSNPLFVSNPSEGERGGSIADRIYDFINEHTPSMSEGVPVNFIAQSLNLLVDDVVLHCGKLTEDAKIYAGYDENGFLAV